jgi:hypothetical protein
MSGDQWVAAALGRPDLVNAAEPLISKRGGEAKLFSDEISLRRFWELERGKGLRALCLLGTQASWLLQEELQLDGALIGRLPFDDPGALHDYVRALASYETTEKSRRIATVVAPAIDEFTARLAATFVEPVTRVLRKLGFVVAVHDGAPGRDVRVGESHLIVLLTHGADGDLAGEPIGIRAESREAIVEACRHGAFLLHLGCNGAGTFAGGRFGALVEELCLGRVPITPHDTVSPFALRCLRAGAGGILAHVDSTWSNAFADARVIEAWVEWVASGDGALAFAAEDVSRESGKAAIDAVQRHGKGDPEASLSWLRFIDLRGFVLLGDPSSFGQWVGGEGAP